MEYRKLGRTGLDVSVLTLGCGAVGGLMVKGEAADQERAVALAVERGVNFLDTAALYGNGASETNLGRILSRLKPNVIVATKVRIVGDQRRDIAGTIRQGLEASLARLGRTHVDLFQLHNTISADGGGDSLTPDIVLSEVVPALEALRREGKVRFIGWTAIGSTPELHAIVAAGVFDTGQMVLNALNPSTIGPMPAGCKGQDYAGLMARAHAAGMGTIGIRVLAGGALSGEMARHSNSMAVVAPIGSGSDYAEDVARARRFLPLVAEGYASSLAELAIRFTISAPALSTTEIGIATVGELSAALDAVDKGPLPPAALARVAAIQQGQVA